MATWPAKTDYATGDVLSAANMNAIGDELNDLDTRVGTAGGFFKNPVLNSSLNVWQRGTSFAYTSGYTYTADRWQVDSAASGRTISRQATGDTTNLPNIQYCVRIARDSGNTATNSINFYQPMETVNSIPFAGQTITFSFYARKGANFSQASSQITAQIQTGTGTDQNNRSGSYTGLATPINQTPTLTTTWQRFSYSATLAATATEIGILFNVAFAGTAGAADYVEITGIQIERGSSVTNYYANGNTQQGELAACQRYLPAFNYSADFFNGYAQSTTLSYYVMPFPVQARVAPTGITVGSVSSTKVNNYLNANGSPTAIAFDSAGRDSGRISVTTTAGTPTLVAANPSSFYISADTTFLFTGCEL